MKKIFVIPANTDLNRGDQSLTWESINIVKDVSPDSEIFLFRSSGTNEDADYQSQLTRCYGYKYVSRILPYPLKNKNKGVRYSKMQLVSVFFGGMKNLLATSMLLSRFKIINILSEKILLNSKQKESYSHFKETEYVVVKGGGFLHSYGKMQDAYLAYFFLFDVLLAHRLGKKVFVMPNSIGPLNSRFAKKIILKALVKCKLLLVRESVSYKLLKSNGLESVLSPDLGFYLKPSENDLKQYLEDQGVDFSKKRIAITMRPYRFDGNGDSKHLYDKYISEFAKVITELSKRNCHVSLVAHTLGPSDHEKDMIALKAVMEILSQNTLRNVTYLEDFALDCHQIERLYSYYDVLIGTRFHSVIYALNVEVPSIAIAYGGNKSYGIMKDIGVSEYVIPIEEMDAERLIAMCEEVEQNKAEYIAKIKLYKEKLEVERETIIKQIKEELEK